MRAMIPFPAIDPELVSVSLFGLDLALRWYALAYIAGILAGWRIGILLLRRERLWPRDVPPMRPAQADDLLTWLILGIVLGGRLGYVLFYNLGFYLQNPGQILVLWEGGMSFHGGMLGVVLAFTIFCRRNGIPILQTADMLAVATWPGLFFGRLANFINAELYGRPTDVPWAMKFPTMCQVPSVQNCPVAGEWFYTGQELARHPSQLYQAGLEGLALGAVLLLLAFGTRALKRPGILVGTFLTGYALARIVVEYVRQPDAQFVSPGNPIGFVIGEGAIGLTMGQLLSLPMLAFGIFLIVWARRGRTVPA
ncbi:prolipoprotein diacylglyceryl transferase [Roseicyclus sp. F158]|uniref:Phosphatidylglycerol--prolipoprotein diacylglyceryl transferase n=1 Tax=Tropicimonas omnivorans TaxID=3075590 RepID=A0ABU3DDH1_9RHOB|nr:prolipoprotein diacylglyceryl transferase [Roseicyclus sp. F158]MDT0681757.1 prolipoprotein diacylglyceryl transferase [Roseicyclus sp. F158]